MHENEFGKKLGFGLSPDETTAVKFNLNIMSEI
jgi:hypothetical protein